MELVRVSRNAWGQEVVQGMSWDLLWVFFALGCVIIVVHAVYRRFFAPKPR